MVDVFSSIKVEILPNVNVHHASGSMCRLANNLGCTVESVFNGTDIFAEPGDLPITVTNRWSVSYQRKRDSEGKLIIDEVVVAE